MKPLEKNSPKDKNGKVVIVWFVTCMLIKLFSVRKCIIHRPISSQSLVVFLIFCLVLQRLTVPLFYNNAIISVSVKDYNVYVLRYCRNESCRLLN